MSDETLTVTIPIPSEITPLVTHDPNAEYKTLCTLFPDLIDKAILLGGIGGMLASELLVIYFGGITGSASPDSMGKLLGSAVGGGLGGAVLTKSAQLLGKSLFSFFSNCSPAQASASPEISRLTSFK